MNTPEIPAGFVLVTSENKGSFSRRWDDFIPGGRWLSGSEWKQVERFRSRELGCFYTPHGDIIVPKQIKTVD